MRHTKLRERLVLVAKKKTGIMDHQRGNVRHSPSVTLYFTHASSSLSLSLSPHFEATSFSHPTKCTPRGAHLLRAADSFLFLIREPGPQKERDEARAGRRQWRGQSNSSAGRVRKIKLWRGDDSRIFDMELLSTLVTFGTK